MANPSQEQSVYVWATWFLVFWGMWGWDDVSSVCIYSTVSHLYNCIDSLVLMHWVFLPSAWRWKGSRCMMWHPKKLQWACIEEWLCRVHWSWEKFVQELCQNQFYMIFTL